MPTPADRRSPRAALERAGAALREGRGRDVVEALREAWRASRDPDLAELYGLYAQRHAGAPIAGATPAERCAAWRERATARPGDPLELPVLLAEPAHDELPSVERLRLLAPWSPDPSLAAVLAAELERPRVPRDQPGASLAGLEAVRLLAAQQDPRQLALLERHAHEPGLSSDQRRQLRGAATSVAAATVRRLDAGARAALAPLEGPAARLRDQAARSRELHAAVLAAPDADEARLVYADWLTSLGDPRGEFIALQVERRASQAAPSARERELLAAHVARWSEPLHAILGRDGRVFEAGFLAAATIEGHIDRARLDDPSWSTLRALDGHTPEALLVRPALAGLRTLYGFLDLDRFVDLRAGGQLGAVERYECSLANPNLHFDAPLGLRALLVRRARDEQLEALLRSPCVEGLDEFAVYFDAGTAVPSNWTGDHRERPLLPLRYALVRASLPAWVSRLRMLDGRTSRASRPQACELVFERDSDGALTRLRLDVHGLALPAAQDPRRALVHELERCAEQLRAAGIEALELGEVAAPLGQAEAQARLEARGLAVSGPVKVAGQ